MFKRHLLLASFSLSMISLTIQAQPVHLPSIYGNTSLAPVAPRPIKGWIVKFYSDTAVNHSAALSARLCFVYSGNNGSHEHGLVYGAQNWAGRWNQEGDQVTLQLQYKAFGLANAGQIRADSVQVELATQVGATQTAFGHWQRWISPWFGNPSLPTLGNIRSVYNVTLEEMPAIDSANFCRTVVATPTLPIEQATEALIKQLPLIDLDRI